MANIRVDLDYQIVDGQPLTFVAPCPCSEIDGLTVCYSIGQGKTLSKKFVFKDAHGNDLTNVNDLFDVNAYVKVVLNTKNGFAYIQNADTNAYLEARFATIENRVTNIDHGGTGADNRIRAFNNLATLPSNTEPVADIPTEWAKLGSFVCYYSTGTKVINKPSTYGTLVQIVAPSTNGAIEATTIQQFWIRQAYGFVYNRSGNNTGWDASAEVNGADAWKRNFGMFPINSVYTTATYTNPGNFLGGTWECIDKQLAYYGFNESKASISGGVVGPVIFHEINTEGSLMGGEDGANIDDYSLYGTVEGHLFTFRLILKISDDTLNTGGLLGKLNFKGLGFSDLPYTIRPIMAYSADGNAMFVCSLEYDTGNIRLLKTIPLGDSNTVPQGSSIAIYDTIPVSKAAMYNAYCDKFVWKRTA